MNMNINIYAVENANELETYNPVSGKWSLHVDSEDRSVEGIEQSVRNYMDADFKISVQVFHADGRAITGDVPSEGTFVAVRE